MNKGFLFCCISLLLMSCGQFGEDIELTSSLTEQVISIGDMTGRVNPLSDYITFEEGFLNLSIDKTKALSMGKTGREYDELCKEIQVTNRYYQTMYLKGYTIYFNKKGFRRDSLTHKMLEQNNTGKQDSLTGTSYSINGSSNIMVSFYKSSSIFASMDSYRDFDSKVDIICHNTATATALAPEASVNFKYGFSKQVLWIFTLSLVRGGSDVEVNFYDTEQKKDPITQMESDMFRSRTRLPSFISFTNLIDCDPITGESTNRVFLFDINPEGDYNHAQKDYYVQVFTKYYNEKDYRPLYDVENEQKIHVINFPFSVSVPYDEAKKYWIGIYAKQELGELKEYLLIGDVEVPSIYETLLPWDEFLQLQEENDNL